MLEAHGPDQWAWSSRSSRSPGRRRRLTPPRLPRRASSLVFEQSAVLLERPCLKTQSRRVPGHTPPRTAFFHTPTLCDADARAMRGRAMPAGGAGRRSTRQVLRRPLLRSRWCYIVDLDTRPRLDIHDPDDQGHPAGKHEVDPAEARALAGWRAAPEFTSTSTTVPRE